VEPFAEQESLGPVWDHVVRVIKAANPPTPKLVPGPVTKSLTRSEVTTTRAKDETTKPNPKVTVGPKQTPVTKSNKTVNTRQLSQPKHTNLVTSNQPTKSLVEISDILDILPLNACVELTRRLLTSVPNLPSGLARSRAVLTIVVLS
jgi:hypothetical protein